MRTDLHRDPSRDSTCQVIFARNDRLSRELRNVKLQLSAAVKDNQELRRRLSLRRLRGVA